MAGRRAKSRAIESSCHSEGVPDLMKMVGGCTRGCSSAAPHFQSNPISAGRRGARIDRSGPVGREKPRERTQSAADAMVRRGEVGSSAKRARTNLIRLARRSLQTSGILDFASHTGRSPRETGRERTQSSGTSERGSCSGCTAGRAGPFSRNRTQSGGDVREARGQSRGANPARTKPIAPGRRKARRDRVANGEFTGRAPQS
jgi:hypothetical protein